MVALSCWPTAIQDASEDKWTKQFRRYFSNGIHKTASNSGLVFADSTGMQVKFPAFEASIEGVHGELSTQTTVGVSAAHSTLDRIDRAVTRLDKSTSPFSMSSIVLPGTPTTTPTPPSLQYTSTIVDVPHVQVRVGHGVSTIAPGDVTDERAFCRPLGHQLEFQTLQHAPVVLDGSGRGYVDFTLPANSMALDPWVIPDDPTVDYANYPHCQKLPITGGMRIVMTGGAGGLTVVPALLVAVFGDPL
jgi:hypothetical protein